MLLLDWLVLHAMYSLSNRMTPVFKPPSLSSLCFFFAPLIMIFKVLYFFLLKPQFYNHLDSCSCHNLVSCGYHLCCRHPIYIFQDKAYKNLAPFPLSIIGLTSLLSYFFHHFWTYCCCWVFIIQLSLLVIHYYVSDVSFVIAQDCNGFDKPMHKIVMIAVTYMQLLLMSN